MTVFSNSSPKIPKSGISGPKFKDFQFCNKLCNKTNSNTLISNMTNFFFQIPVEKYPNKVFLIPNVGIFICLQNLAIPQIRGCWFQMWQYRLTRQILGFQI